MPEPLRIKEDVKREVLKCLIDSIKKEMVADDFTITNITKVTREKKETIENVLSELEDEKLITKHDISLRIYLPNVEKGHKFLKDIAGRKVLSISLYWLFLVSLAILWIAIPSLELNLPSAQTFAEMYIQGVQNGIVGSAIAGLVGAYILDKISRVIVKWRLVSAESYNQIVRVMKLAMAILIPSLLAFFALYRTYGSELASAVVMIFIAVMAAAVAYVQLIWKKKES